jgi:uncharacterized membrane protein YeaQ/YmgE (transglycosylase-associated protein family)
MATVHGLTPASGRVHVPRRLRGPGDEPSPIADKKVRCRATGHRDHASNIHNRRLEVVGIIAWLVLGLVAGLIAERVTGERTGWVLAGVAGIFGALLGGWLAKVIFHVHSLNTFFNISTWVTAIVGAVILLLIVRTVTGSRHHARV